MEELVWRKAGEERCTRTEKKALPAAATATATATTATAAVAVPESTPNSVLFDTNGFHKTANKREEANHKLNERYLVGQAKQNPFMPNSNFINDLEVQLNFLTPQKSI